MAKNKKPRTKYLGYINLIIEEFWGKNTKHLCESANEGYCNTPVREFRNRFESYFGSTKISDLEIADAQKIKEFFSEIMRVFKWEFEAWRDVAILFNKQFKTEW